jgi:hypothetical protein
MRLTIVIPTLNRDYCVGRAIESALAQTFRDIEVIVSNNGSSDQTRTLLAGFRDPRLRVFHHETTMPMADHANFLIGQARGELFVGLSDDDYLEPTFAERVLEVYDERPDIGFLYTRCWTHVGGRAVASPAGPAFEDTVPFFENYFSGNRHIFWCACVTRVGDLRRLGGQPPGILIGDMYFWTQLAFDGPVACVDAPLAHYTYLVDNTSIGIPACKWAAETQMLTQRIAARIDEFSSDIAANHRVKRLMSRYLARTAANQFALNASRGASKATLVQSLRSCGRVLVADPATAVPRVALALVAPTALVKLLVLKFVATRSRWMRSESLPGKGPA